MTEIKTCRVMAISTVVGALGCIVATVVALASMGVVYGLAPDAGEIMAYLYQINAFLCVFATLFGCGVLFGRSGRELLIQISLWAMLVLAVMYFTPFVTGSIAYLASMEVLAAFRYLAAYLPFIALVPCLAMLISTWYSVSHRVTSITAMICSLISVFASVVYLWQLVPAALDTQTLFDGGQMWAIAFGYVTVTLVCLTVWFGTATDATFRSVFCGADVTSPAGDVIPRDMDDTDAPTEQNEQRQIIDSIENQLDSALDGASLQADKPTPANQNTQRTDSGKEHIADSVSKHTASRIAATEQSDDAGALSDGSKSDHGD